MMLSTLKKILVFVEDRQFFKHRGVSLKGIARSFGNREASPTLRWLNNHSADCQDLVYHRANEVGAEKGHRTLAGKVGKGNVSVTFELE